MIQLPTLERLASALGVTLTTEALAHFAHYRDLLLDWNKRVNLTRVTDPVEVEVRLFADALLLLPYIRQFHAANPSEPLRLVDIGAGAGFPGLPLKIAEPELDVLLIEGTGKKVAFMEATIAELGLTGVRAVHGRAEDLAHQPEHRGRFDLVTARAVARLPTLLEFCLPFLRRGGWGLFPKGREAQIEVDEAAQALKTFQARVIGVEPAPLPELAGTTVVLVEQAGVVPKKYPRRAGMPVKRPL